MSENRTPRITPIEFERLARDGGEFIDTYGFVTEAIGDGTARMRLPFRQQHIRPGGTIAGPSLMALADFAIYAAIMGALGPVRMAVTSSLSINFLRRPSAADVVAEAVVVKTTRRLAFAEVTLFTDGEAAPIAHVTSTYAIPRVEAGENTR